MTARTLSRVIDALPSSDGAGVRIKRSLGQSQFARMDPFLMLDEFRSDDAADYIGGFPSHPHRGFETVTYMLAGAMLHKDSLGNEGHLKAGDVQWMTAARGIVHSEMPQQEEGLMHGFQLWINLPAKEKMKTPRYQDIPSERITEVSEPGLALRVIAGTIERGGKRHEGPVSGITTEPTYLDVTLEANTPFIQSTPREHSGVIYVFAGEITVVGKTVKNGQAALLSEGDEVGVTAGAAGARFLMLTAKPINEPVVQHGPFVMNTREEIEQAVRDFQNGRFVSEAPVIS
ncbi:MAG: pirin family protein [Halomonadaceae bacterium]|nr:MAG: pirin family protein [Halomonadaceae bacterium]